MPDRRDFLRSLALATAGCALPGGGAPPATRQVERVGLQLYTVRAPLAADVDRTLARIAEIGYAEVETAGFHGRTAAAFRGALDAAGLRAPSAHVPLAEIRDRTAATLEAATALGARFVVLPWLDATDRRTLDQYRAVADVLNRAGEAARGAGIGMAYHNHDFELAPIDGVRPLDVLLERTQRDLVSFELDLYWAVKAGADPLAYFARWPGRFTMVHVKDSAGAPQHEMVEVGRGTIDFARLFARREEAGIRHFFVEHDNPRDPMASIATSYQAVRGLRF